MGFTNLMGGGDPAAGGATPTPVGGVPSGDAAANFDNRPGNYFESKYPIAGGLAHMVFGNNAPSPGAGAPVPALAALPPGGTQQDSSLLAMNAQPQQGGGGLAALLKLFA